MSAIGLKSFNQMLPKTFDLVKKRTFNQLSKGAWFFVLIKKTNFDQLKKIVKSLDLKNTTFAQLKFDLKIFFPTMLTQISSKKA